MNDCDDSEDDPIFANAPVLHFAYPSETGIALTDLQALFRNRHPEVEAYQHFFAGPSNGSAC